MLILFTVGCFIIFTPHKLKETKVNNPLRQISMQLNKWPSISNFCFSKLFSFVHCPSNIDQVLRKSRKLCGCPATAPISKLPWVLSSPSISLNIHDVTRNRRTKSNRSLLRHREKDKRIKKNNKKTFERSRGCCVYPVRIRSDCWNAQKWWRRKSQRPEIDFPFSGK